MNRRRTLVHGPDETAQDALDEMAEGDVEACETCTEEEGEEQDRAEEADETDEPARPRTAWVAPTLAILAALGWTGFFGWVHHQEMMAGAAPAQWAEWIVQWCVPLALLAALYLLAMRNSRREALRFGTAAQMLARESMQLENRLKVINRELALARSFIESQARDLETLGRLAAERLSGQAERLEGLIHTNSAQVESIGSVSQAAVANMEVLRDQLPVLTNSARDISNQIGSAGKAAQEQVNALVAAFERLNQFGEAGEAHVVQIKEKVEATLASFEQQISALGDLTSQRFDRLRASSDEFRHELDTAEERVFDAIASRSEALARQLQEDAEALREREAAAAATMRERLVALRVEGEKLVDVLDSGQEAATRRWSDAITALEDRMKQVLEGVIKLDETAMTNARMRLVALNEEASKVDQRLAESMAAFEADFQRRREADEARQQEALARLEEQVAAFDQRMSKRQEEHLAHVASLAERGEALAGRLSVLDDNMKQLGSQAEDTGQRLTQAADALADRLSQSRAILEENGTFITRLTDDRVRLLEIIRSSADHSEGALSDAVASAEQRLTAFQQTARDLHDLIKDAEARGENLAQQIDRARETGSASLEQLAQLEGQLASVTHEAERLAECSSGQLREALETLRSASASVLENLRSEQTQAVRDLAQQVAEASREQLAAAMRRHAEETIAELEQATARADDAGRETAQLLRDQLARVNELVANLEARVDYARQKAEEQVDNDFVRRTALITEALNSASIDIAKAFDNDIGDTQWLHYLRGDRGIFTRRAVRLLDKHDARAVSAIYSEDAEFRETVNRYIHDFEAMLRTILSTRDGNAMAVTLLSSDMGKLYVALAQAIDRLRD